jgi:5-methylcytosine-specific restriction endonuclease McrA
MAIERMCKDCGSCFNQYNTTQVRCYKCTKKRFKPINKKGKEYKKWQAFKKTIPEHIKPKSNGLYDCGICHQEIPKRQLTFDHIKPQGWGHVDKYNYDNIQPAHWLCNYEKGSKRNLL